MSLRFGRQSPLSIPARQLDLTEKHIEHDFFLCRRSTDRDRRTASTKSRVTHAAQRLSFEGATGANLSYSGFYWTLDFGRKTGVSQSDMASGHLCFAVMTWAAGNTFSPDLQLGFAAGVALYLNRRHAPQGNPRFKCSKRCT